MGHLWGGMSMRWDISWEMDLLGGGHPLWWGHLWVCGHPVGGNIIWGCDIPCGVAISSWHGDIPCHGETPQSGNIARGGNTPVE